MSFGGCTDESAGSRLAAQEDVFTYGQVGYQVEFLIDDGYTRLLGNSRRGHINVTAGYANGPSIGLVGSGQHLDESTLSRPILAH